MDLLAITSNYFTRHGFALTDKARRSLATAIGLSGSIKYCDETFVSLGLRRTNSVLAHITDRFHLDFTETDDLAIWQASSKDEDFVREELRLKGFKETDRLFRDYDFGDGDIDYISRDEETPELEYVGVEGEPDYATAGRILDASTPEIFLSALAAATADHRNRIETIDFIPAIAELPFTSEIFRKARVSQDRLRTELARFKTLEPFAETQQFLLSFGPGGRLRLKTFALLDGLKYEERNVAPQDLVVQVSAAAPFVDQRAVEEFEELINWPSVSERDIHQYLLRQPHLLQGDQYYALHSELVLARADEGPLVPDFFAELGHRNYVDIIDLKKPNEQLIIGTKNRRGFSAAVNSAVYQLREYRDYFGSSRRRNEFYSRYGLRAWQPKIAVVIGRTPCGHEYDELLRARRSVVDAEIITYDDLIERARRRCIIVGSKKSHG